MPDLDVSVARPPPAGFTDARRTPVFFVEG